MNTRYLNQYLSAQNTQYFNSFQAPAYGTGNLFVGGNGTVSIANQTEDFTCLGGNSNLFIANRGNNAFIKGGSAGNTIMSVGRYCAIMGADSDDELFSVGENCDISLGGGNDKVFASGVGTIVDGGANNDLLTGTVSGLSYSSLFGLDVMTMLATIRNTSYQYLTKSQSE